MWRARTNCRQQGRRVKVNPRERCRRKLITPAKARNTMSHVSPNRWAGSVALASPLSKRLLATFARPPLRFPQPFAGASIWIFVKCNYRGGPENDLPSRTWIGHPRAGCGERLNGAHRSSRYFTLPAPHRVQFPKDPRPAHPYPPGLAPFPIFRRHRCVLILS